MSLENLKSRNDLSVDEINLLMDNENNTKVYKKLSYFRFKALGFTKKESYKLAGIKKSTAYNLEDQWVENGYNGLLPKGKGGRSTKLNETQLNELKSILDTKDEWLINDVIELIKNKWNIDYSYVGAQNLLETHFNIKIGNYYSNKQENKKQTRNIVENFNDIDQKNKDELNKIIGLIKNENDIFVYRKLIYLLFKLLGFSTDVASSFLNITSVTGNSWTKQWNENAYEGLLKKPGQGRKSKLTDEELNSVKKN